MDPVSFQARVFSLVANQLSLSEDSVRGEQRLIEDLGADTLDIVELLLEIEEQFGVEISDDDVEKMKTVQNVLDYLSSNSVNVPSANG